MIKYFSKSRRCIVGTFLKLHPIETGDAKSLLHDIKVVIEKHGLDLQKCYGIGTDNASVMVGKHSGLFTLMKREVKHLVLVPCVCHSLQLAISEVSKEFLPTQLEFLISETYNWFARSSGRQQEYRQILNALNGGHDPLKIVQACQTRWLSVEIAVSRVLAQWIELETHFKLARTHNKCIWRTIYTKFTKIQFCRAT